jgi:protein subunit release factor B
MEKAFSVTIHDCEVQTFRSGGKGGQNQNKRETGVRVIHKPSGAVGESREERSQLINKRLAFRRMAESSKFRIWTHRTLHGLEKVEDRVARDMEPRNLLVEGREGKGWIPITELE